MAKRKKIKKHTSKKQQKSTSQPSATLKPAVPNKLRLYHCLFLFALAFAIYSNTLSNGYVLDDTLFITGNSYTLNGTAGIKDIWTHDAFVGAHGREFDLEGGRYRPLSITIFAIVYEFFGLNPLPGHLMNVIFFGLTGIIIYLLLLRLMPSKNEWIPLIAATIFVVHPVHTEVVANIKSLDELFSTMFLLLTLLFVFKPGPRNLVLSGLFYLLALLSKESALTGLAIIPATLFFFSNSTVKKIAIRSAPYVAIAIFYLLLREQFSGGFGKGFEAVNPMDSPYILLGTSDKLATITYVCGRYLLLLFWPQPLSWDYSYHEIPDMSWSDIGPLISLVIYAAIGYFAIKSLRTKSVIGYGILFYLLSFSIASNYFINIGTTMGERFIFMPSVGFCIAIAGLLTLLLKIDLKGTFLYQTKWLIPLIIIVPLGAYATYDRNKAWKNNFTLYEADIETVPNSARSRLFYGIECLGKFQNGKDQQFLDRAIQQMELATQINPIFYHAFYNLGLAYQENNDHQNALRCFNKVLEVEPMHINTHYMLGVTLAKGMGRIDEGIRYMEKGVSIGYDDQSGFSNLGIAYGMKGEFQKAIDIFLKGAAMYPDNAKIYLNLAVTYQNMGDQQNAEMYFQKAFTLDPSLNQTQN